MKQKLTLRLYCKRCGYSWVPRGTKPCACPSCKSYRYDESKRIRK